jgi:hypothetical protein
MDKHIPRRTFLRMLTGVVAAGFAGGGMSATKALLSRPSGIRIDGALSYNTFASLVGQDFTLTMLDRSIKYRMRMQLVEVNSVFLSPNNDQFYVIFKVFDTKRPNGVYPIQHATAGSAKLFLQPMGKKMSGNYCRAEFNLLT